MTTTTQDKAAKYRQIRKLDPTATAKDAWRLVAHYFQETPPLGKRFERDGFEVILTTDYDPDADLSFYGEWSDRWAPGAIKNLDGWYGSDYTEKNGDVYPWFVPGYDYEADIVLNRRRMGRHEAWLRAQEYKRKDMERLKDTTEYFIIARVYREGVELGRASLHGIGVAEEWRIYGDDEHQVLTSAADDVIDEAIDEAKARLAKLVASAT